MTTPGLDPLPQLERAAELRLLVVEGLMALVGGLGLLLRPVAYILAAERGGDDQHLAQGLVAPGFEDHASDPRVQRQARQLGADRREFVGLVHRAQLGQQGVAIGDRLPGWRLDEGKFVDRSQAQRLHAQDHAGERAAQDLGVGERRPAGEFGLAVQAHADAVGHPPAAPRALLCRGLADGLDLQLLDLVAPAVALDPREPGVDHVADAGHRQRGLGHVGGQHDAPAVAGLEDTILLLLRQAGKQRQDFRRRPTLGLLQQMPPQVVGGIADLALTGQEDEDVARARSGNAAAY